MKISYIDTNASVHFALIYLKTAMKKNNLPVALITSDQLDEEETTLEMVHEFDPDCGIHAIAFLEPGDDVKEKEKIVHDYIADIKIKIQTPPTETLQ